MLTHDEDGAGREISLDLNRLVTGVALKATPLPLVQVRSLPLTCDGGDGVTRLALWKMMPRDLSQRWSSGRVDGSRWAAIDADADAGTIAVVVVVVIVVVAAAAVAFAVAVAVSSAVAISTQLRWSRMAASDSMGGCGGIPL